MPAAAFALKPYTPEEHELQINCTEMFRKLLRPGVHYTGIDNAFSLNKTIGRNGRPIGFAEAAKRKARGIRAGIPDLQFVAPPVGTHHAIELKRSREDVLRTEQEIIINELLAAGAKVQICWTLMQVFITTRDWGLLRPGAWMQ